MFKHKMQNIKHELKYYNTIQLSYVNPHPYHHVYGDKLILHEPPRIASK